MILFYLLFFLSFCLFIILSLFNSVFLSCPLFLFVSFCHFVFLSFCLSVFLSFCLSILVLLSSSQISRGRPGSLRVILCLSGRWKAKSGLDGIGWMVISGPELRYVATVTTGGLVKFVPAV